VERGRGGKRERHAVFRLGIRVGRSYPKGLPINVPHQNNELGTPEYALQ